MPTTLQTFPISEELRVSHPKLVTNFTILADAVDAVAAAVALVAASASRSLSTGTIASPGTTNLAAGSPDHYGLVTINATTGTVVLSLTTAGRSVLDKLMLVIDLTTTGGATVEIRDGGGDLLNSFTNDGLTPRVVATLIFDGAKWKLLTFA